MKLYQLVSEDNAQSILNATKSMEWSVGRARTKELEGTVKQNGEILTANNSEAHSILHQLGAEFMRNTSIQLDHIPLKFHPPKFSRYQEGDRYHLHTDSPWMGDVRTDLSCTIWLSDPDSYEGGELRVNGKSIKGKPGQCLVYECGQPHEVTPVTKGERVCAVMWAQSRIRDPRKRKIVTDFRRFLSKVESNQELFVEGGAIHSSIIRMWMED